MIEVTAGTTILRTYVAWLDDTGAAVEPSASPANNEWVLTKNGAVETYNVGYNVGLSTFGTCGQMLTVTLTTALAANDIVAICGPFTISGDTQVFNEAWSCIGAATASDVSVVVSPIQTTAVSRVSGDTLTAYVGESMTFTLTPVDATGTAVNTTGMTLAVTIEDARRNDLQTIANGSITKTSTTYSFTTSAASANVRELSNGQWCCRRTDTGVVIGRGPYVVAYAPSADA